MARVERAAFAGDHVFYYGQPRFLAQPLHHLLIHGDRRRQHARADVGQIGQFEQALHRAVFAECAVEDRKDDVDPRIAPGFGTERGRLPAAFFRNQDLDDVVLVTI